MNLPNSTTIKVSGLNFHGPFSSAQPLLNQSGVYVILTRGALPGSQWQVLDVGESGTLRSRIENHDRRSQWTAHSQRRCALYTGLAGGQATSVRAVHTTTVSTPLWYALTA